MPKILDQFGQAISLSDIAEPQTASLGPIINRYLDSALDGLTPARLATILREADNGDLMAQHRLFSDMEGRDAQILAEMGKRKNALAGIDWSIAPPPNATAAEKATAEWVQEMIQDAIDPIEDLIVFLMEAVGHGFACAELEWSRIDGYWLPVYHPRPQEWFRLDVATRTELRLADLSTDGAPLRPFGWVWHVAGKAKTGYMGRMGLYRTLAWPFIYKAYAIGDFAEFLETFGLPFIVGKYFAGASDDEKRSLLRAVTALGHDARAIMPQEMQLEISKITGGGDSTPHLAMAEWADKAISKVILGATLTSQADGKSSTNALGNIHNEVRKDILRSDARQLAATLTRDLIYPLVAINRGIEGGLRRCPRLVFDTGESADMIAFADALPKLAGVMDIPASWAYDKLRIPQPKDGEPLLVVRQIPAPATPATTGLAALSASPADTTDPLAGETATLSQATTSPWAGMLDQIRQLVDAAPNMAALQARLMDSYGSLPVQQLTKVMASAFALAELKGMADVMDSAE